MKKLLCLVLTVAVAVSLCSCGEVYEDTNGPDDFSLQTITDTNIINLDLGASGLGYYEMNLGGIMVKEYSSTNFNGVERIYLTNFILPSDVIIYIGTLNVKSGNFRLVIVNDDEIIFDFKPGIFSEEFLFENLSGSFAIHVAGESAEFNFDIKIY